MKPATLYSIGTCGNRTPTEGNTFIFKFKETIHAAIIGSTLVGVTKAGEETKIVTINKPLIKISYTISSTSSDILKIIFYYLDGTLESVTGTGTINNPEELMLDFRTMTSSKGVTIAQVGACNYYSQALTGLRFGVADID